MYDIRWAELFEGFKDDEDLDIHKFACFFSDHIAGTGYIYGTEDKELPNFEIHIRNAQLPHLMGLQHWNNLPVTQAEKQMQKMLSGEWDLNFLKRTDERAWRKFRLRVSFLPFLYKMLNSADSKEECRVRLVHPVQKSGFLRRNIQMIIQKDYANEVYVLELRRSSGQIYIPASLTAHRPQQTKDLKLKHKDLRITSISKSPIS